MLVVVAYHNLLVNEETNKLEQERMFVSGHTEDPYGDYYMSSGSGDQADAVVFELAIGSDRKIVKQLLKDLQYKNTKTIPDECEVVALGAYLVYIN